MLSWKHMCMPEAAELEWTFMASHEKMWALLSISKESSPGTNSTPTECLQGKQR